MLKKFCEAYSRHIRCLTGIRKKASSQKELFFYISKREREGEREREREKERKRERERESEKEREEKNACKHVYMNDNCLLCLKQKTKACFFGKEKNVFVFFQEDNTAKEICSNI